MVEIQTTQVREMSEAVESHRRRMAEIQTQSERSLAKLDEKYKSLKEQSPHALREQVDRAGRPVARTECST